MFTRRSMKKQNKKSTVSEIKTYIQVYAANCIQNAHTNYATSKGKEKLKNEKNKYVFMLYGYNKYEYRHNLAK